MNNQRILEILRNVHHDLAPSNTTTLLYIPPAQQLRNRANEIEQEQKNLQDLEGLIKYFDGLITQH